MQKVLFFSLVFFLFSVGVKAEIDSSQVNISEYNYPFKIEWQCPAVQYLKGENKILYKIGRKIEKIIIKFGGF